jgi:hypothetical protein
MSLAVRERIDLITSTPRKYTVDHVKNSQSTVVIDHVRSSQRKYRSQKSYHEQSEKNLILQKPEKIENFLPVCLTGGPRAVRWRAMME